MAAQKGFTPKALTIKPPKLMNVSTKNLTMPKNSLKVGAGVKTQHIAKINWGKTNTITQKPSSQL
jgi:hypothetical protein